MTTEERPASATRYRKLRIAWSVACGVLAVLLCLLWVRSIKHSDTFRIEVLGVRGFAVWSNLQQLGLFTYPLEDEGLRFSLSSHLSSGIDLCPPADNKSGFKVTCYAGYAALVLPHWLFAIAAAIPPSRMWLRQRDRFNFSLRTLLLAITLGSIVLGLIVWAVRG